ncbi:MAG: 16S rRNA (uracil(1498)-N(3))-methyltransferase [Thermoanaerobaculales bacterium]|jgi:16S rRNA (uracil1498-N3)-methyltransferase|nr:16S rRNA (uracil(1498)-N(3))-methyltransferase [Thermoanaerobaculales bacterium]
MKQPPWLLAPEGGLAVGAVVVLDDVETRHAAGALRLATGRRVTLTDGAGLIAQGELTLPRRGPATVRVDSVVAAPRATAELTIAVGVLAGPAMDVVVQKAVELGASRVTPVCCERSQLDRRRAEARSEHWRRLALQALKQCHRARALAVAPPVRFGELLEGVDPSRGVVAAADGGPVSGWAPVPDPVLLIGPEGGLSPGEARALDEAGWQRLRLGPHVLRAETAVIAGAALILDRLGG